MKRIWLAIIVLIDIITKYLVRIYGVQTTGHFVDITFTKNTGALWSLFSNVNYVNIIFILLSIIALIILYKAFEKEKEELTQLGMVIISAGIIGNLIDRIIYGSVIDWINFHWWPVFNIADSSIVIGVIIVVIQLIRTHPYFLTRQGNP